MSTINWSHYEWNTRQQWGQIHPDKPNCWYDPDALYVDNYGHIHLYTVYEPKPFDELGLTSKVGVGLISSVHNFRYGTFEIEAKLPRGKGLWPAFWLAPWNKWPPEIDVLEGYSSRSCWGYFKWDRRAPFSFWDVQTNVHYGEKGNLRSIGGRSGLLGLKDPSKHFFKYRLEWFPDSIRIFYDEELVREVLDPYVLSQFKDAEMSVIINNSLVGDYDTNGLTERNFKSSDFEVKHFRYKAF